MHQSRRGTLLAFIAAIGLQAAIVFAIIPSLATLPKDACAVSRVTPTKVFCGKDGKLVGESTGSEDDKALMAQFKKHAIVARDAGPGTSLSGLKVQATSAGWQGPVFFGLVSMAILAFLAVGAQVSALKWLVLGADGRLSNSKVQLCIASGLTITSVYACAFARMMAGMPFDAAAAILLPESLTAIISASVVAAGAAKIVAGAKPLPQTTVDWKFSDLFRRDDGETFELSDTQMFILTSATMLLFARQVILALSEGIKLEAEIKLPEPTLSLALMFGGSLAAYIAPKLSALIPPRAPAPAAAQPPGPNNPGATGSGSGPGPNPAPR